MREIGAVLIPFAGSIAHAIRMTSCTAAGRASDACALRPCPDTCTDWPPAPGRLRRSALRTRHGRLRCPRQPAPPGAPDAPPTHVPHDDPTVGATATMPLDGTERFGDLLDSSLGEKVAELGDLLRGLDVGVLVNNVGASYPYACYFHEVDEALALNLIRLNVEAVTRVTHAVLPSMLECGRGATVNIGSGVSAIMPSDSLYTVYVATKAAHTVDLLQQCIESNADLLGDREIEIDIHAVSDDLLLDLKKHVDKYFQEKEQSQQAKPEPSENEVVNVSGLSHSSTNPCKGGDPVEEDVDISYLWQCLPYHVRQRCTNQE